MPPGGCRQCVVASPSHITTALSRRGYIPNHVVLNTVISAKTTIGLEDYFGVTHDR